MRSLLLILFLCSSSMAYSSTNEHNFTKVNDIKWTTARGFDLTMDIYTPDTGKESYPVIVIFHGGGWQINNETIMDEPAAYLASNSEYVVANVNYRLLGDQGNTVTLNEVIEDAMGAVLWVKHHIAEYKGDPSKVILTGDSAGGHLALMVAFNGQKLSSNRFDQEPIGFKPSWLPEGKSPEELATENALEIQSAMISYAVFDVYGWVKSGDRMEPKNRGYFGSEFNIDSHPNYYLITSPQQSIPKASEKAMPPMLFTVGSRDDLTTPETHDTFLKAYEEAGHSNYEYWIHEGRPHAFLDSGCNEYLKICFEDDAIPALKVMIDYLDKQFYPN